MKSKIIAIMLSAVLAASIITACGNSNVETQENTSISEEQVATTDTATDNAESPAAEETQTGASFDEVIASLHAGQTYAYAPICEGENALLVTSYAFDLDGKLATYEATIYAAKDGSIEKVTTVQSGGTAYPIAVTDDNCLILNMRNDISKGYVSKETGKFVITEGSQVNYQESEEGTYHNFKDGATEIVAESTLFDELNDKYFTSDVVSFEKAGASAEGAPILAGGVYAAYKGEDLYNVDSYYIFENETSGSTQTPDGLSGLPFTYEQNGEDIVFHFGSADDTSEAKFGWDIVSYPTLTFSGENAETITLSCLGNQSPETFDAVKYYDNDSNLYMNVTSFDEKSLTGNLLRQEKIKQEYVDNAEIGSQIYSVNGTMFTAVSFEDVNKEIEYGTDDEFKADVVGSSRFDGFLVKDSDDDFYYALEKGEYDQEYKVVAMMHEEYIRKSIAENVTFTIKDNCEIVLQKFVKDGEYDNLAQEYIVGREFKGDNYPGWSADAQESYMTEDMLMSIGVIDGELYNASQIYIP